MDCLAACQPAASCLGFGSVFGHSWILTPRAAVTPMSGDGGVGSRQRSDVERCGVGRPFRDVCSLTTVLMPVSFPVYPGISEPGLYEPGVLRSACPSEG